MFRRRWGYRRPYKRNYIIDFIKVYLIFFIALSGLVLSIKLLYKESPKKEKVEPPSPSSSASLDKIKRSEAFNRGMDMINYVWEYNQDKNAPKDTSQIALPAFLRDVKTKKVSGIPYAWGGYTALDLSNQKDVKNFEDAVEKGYTTGNVYCEGGYKAQTTGLDCSGFVSAVFSLKQKVGTNGFGNAFTQIDLKELKPMDVLVSKDNHALIYLKETADKTGIIAMEETTGTNYDKPEKTVISYRSWSEIKNGINSVPYVAMRYNKIQEDSIKFFKDNNEFNNYTGRAVEIALGKAYQGYIDYADDVDYFKFNVSNKELYLLSISNLPDFCTAEIVSKGGNLILSIDKKGSYALNLDKGTFYIKFFGKDFEYSSDKEYTFLLGK